MPFFFSVVPEYRRLVHFRFGKLVGKGERGPGFVFPLFPNLWSKKEPRSMPPPSTSRVSTPDLPSSSSSAGRRRGALAPNACRLPVTQPADWEEYRSWK